MTVYSWSSLAEAKNHWDQMIKGKGGHCPCCDRFGKIYERQFNVTMARSLIWLSNCSARTPEGWINVPKSGPRAVVRTNQLPTVRWWGLIERLPNDNPKVKNSGMWRVTKSGIHFIYGRSTIAKSVFTYAGEPVEFSDERITLREAFDTQFDYEQVMGKWSPVAHPVPRSQSETVG